MPLQEWSENIWVVRLQDEPAFSDEVLPLIDRMEGSPPAQGIVIDFSDVTQINSSNLSQLLRVRKASVDADTGLYLVSPQDAVWSVFLMTGLDKVFQFSQDTATALTHLQID